MTSYIPTPGRAENHVLSREREGRGPISICTCAARTKEARWHGRPPQMKSNHEMELKVKGRALWIDRPELGLAGCEPQWTGGVITEAREGSENLWLHRAMMVACRNQDSVQIEVCEISSIYTRYISSSDRYVRAHVATNENIIKCLWLKFISNPRPTSVPHKMICRIASMKGISPSSIHVSLN